MHQLKRHRIKKSWFIQIKIDYNHSIINDSPKLEIRFWLNIFWLPNHSFPGGRNSNSHLAPTAVSQTLHDGVNFQLEHLGQLRAELVHSRCFAVVEPGVVEHLPDVVNILPRLLVLPGVQLPLDGGKVNWVLYNVKVVLGEKKQK